MMKTALFQTMLLVFGFCGVGFIGCGDGRPANVPKLHPVTLVFTLNDAPLADASVVLHSTDGDNSQWAVFGMTDAAGRVSLTTNGRYPGVPQGKYKVSVEKIVQSGPSVPQGSELPEDEEQRQKILRDIHKKTTTIRIVDEKYLDRQTTPLEYEVVVGNNERSFDLGKSVNVSLFIPLH